MKKLTPKQRAKLIEEALGFTYESLSSHTYWTHTKNAEGFRFHKEAIRDYARLMWLISNLYD